MIGGREKSLKTSIALDAAVSAATGTKWLAQFDSVKAASVIYFLGEGGLVFARDTIHRIAQSKELNFRDIDKLVICDQVPSLGSQEELREAAAVIRDRQAGIVFIDPFYLAMGSEAAQAANVFAMGGLLQRLLRTCQVDGATPILVHHFRKSQQAGAVPDLADLSQAGVAEFAGQWVLLGRQVPTMQNARGSMN